ncbi:MAG: hypothetical protein ACHQU0_03660 [Candidatus Paceibacteria bacterium]
MRPLFIAAFMIAASFTMPLFALADTNCTTTINGQTVVGLIDPATGACSVSSSVGTNTGNTGSTGQSVTLINPLQGGGNLQSFLLGILDFVIYIGSIAVILMLIFVGYKFVVAQGKPSEIEEARRMLLWTIVGGLILLGSKAISLGITATIQSLGG